jgi:hypothetical protein
MAATATKAKPKTKVEEETKDELEALDEEIETLDPVALSIERKFTNPGNGEEVVFIQKEMGFLTKTKFSRLLAGTLRLADESDDKGSILSSLGENTSWLPLIFQAIELAPDFLEEAFILALRVPPNEHNFSLKEVLIDMPSRQFEALYAAYVRRKASEELKERRSLELAAVWGNSNYDGENNKIRNQLANSIDERFTRAIHMIYGEETEEESMEIDYDDPFYAPVKRAQEEKLPKGGDVI